MTRTDNPVRALVAAVEDAAAVMRQVHENWEQGDLAAAVNDLNPDALEEALEAVKKKNLAVLTYTTPHGTDVLFAVTDHPPVEASQCIFGGEHRLPVIDNVLLRTLGCGEPDVDHERSMERAGYYVVLSCDQLFDFPDLPGPEVDNDDLTRRVQKVLAATPYSRYFVITPEAHGRAKASRPQAFFLAGTEEIDLTANAVYELNDYDVLATAGSRESMSRLIEESGIDVTRVEWLNG